MTSNCESFKICEIFASEVNCFSGCIFFHLSNCALGLAESEL